MSEIKSGGLDQYGAEPFKQQQCGTAGVEGVKPYSIYLSVAARASIHLKAQARQ